MALAVGMVGLTAWAAAGQEGPVRGSVRGGPTMMMLRHPAVQEELKLSEEQRNKLKEVMMKMRDRTIELIENGERNKVQEVMKGGQKDLEKVLTAKQNKRLKEVILQVHGVWAMITPETAKELRLTEEQTKKLRAIQTESVKAMDKLSEGKAETRKELQKQLGELHTATTEKAVAVLTEKQRGQWKEMQGEPFKGEIHRVLPGRAQEKR
jgi:Spy/CpxP family protein refolding chaperone